MRRAFLAILLSTMPAMAFAQSAPETSGVEDSARYTLDRNGSDLVRIDKTTGAISTCVKREAGWACQAAPEERAAYESEIARLQDENAALKQQLAIAQPREAVKPLESKPSAPKGYRVPDAQLRLPTNEDIDRALALAGRVWKRLADMLNDVRADIREKI